MGAAPQLVVVVDEEIERQLLVSYLTTLGFRVTGLGHARALRALLRHESPDLVLLDLQLSGEDGVGLVAELREQRPEVGVIIISAAEETAARVRALDAGADDLVVRPFEPRELLARVRSVLRRLLPPDRRGPAGRVRVGRCLLDIDRGELLDGDAAAPLAGGEFALLRTFAANPHRPLEPEWLAQVTGRDAATAGPPIALQVEALRQKVERDPTHPLAIRTVAGIGYMFVPDAE